MNLATFLKRTFFFVIVLPLVFSSACKNQTGGQNGWQDLFDGKTLDGWKVLGGKADFYVEDGMIVCNTKMDIDGGEGTALDGMQRLLAEKRPILLVELHGEKAAHQVWNHLRQHNYSVHQMRHGYPKVTLISSLSWKAYIIAVSDQKTSLLT